MTLLIDGYNLLYASGIFGDVRGRLGGESSRQALLDFLVESLPAVVVARTTVVFDAAEAPPGLPRQLTHRGLNVRFAPRNSEADALLEEIIEATPDPRRLTVVSSDHRVQRAARRRNATSIDSEIWYADTLRARRDALAPREESKPDGVLSPSEVNEWLREFGLPPGNRAAP